MSSKRGYVMFLAALIVATMALVLLAVARVGADALPTLRAGREDARRAVAAESAFSRVAFMLLTEPIGPRALQVRRTRGPAAAERALRLDGRYYNFGDGIYIAVQDELGLVNLNAPDDVLVASLLEVGGVERSRARALAAALADFVDEDDLVRNAGAEAADYARVGLPSPTNRQIDTRWSALEALGWREHLNAEQRQFFWASTTTGKAQENLNLNTAPTAVIEAFAGDRRAAAALLARREGGDILDIQEIEALTVGSGRASGANIAFAPGTAFRLVVVVDDGGSGDFYERRLSFADDGADRPAFWRIERDGRGSAELGQLSEPEPLPTGVAFDAP